VKLRLVRHATLQLEYSGRLLPVDPLFAPAGSYPPLRLGRSRKRNPAVDLPCAVEDLASPDAVVLTHTHFDHFDRAAAVRPAKDVPVLGQPCDARKLHTLGFSRFLPVDRPRHWGRIDVVPVSGRHGSGIIGRAMGHVKGFVLSAEAEPTVYLAGDTIWCPAVAEAIATYRPDVIVVNAGAARFDAGAPITMTSGDVASVLRGAPGATTVAVHMDTLDHCRLLRSRLASDLQGSGLTGCLCIPRDGESIVANPGRYAGVPGAVGKPSSRLPAGSHPEGEL
jgi:L-ascorbate metabolism protein UlaG (beta-lactamase superfamily)